MLKIKQAELEGRQNLTQHFFRRARALNVSVLLQNNEINLNLLKNVL